MEYYLSPKQPGETVRGRYGDFANLLSTGETVSSATVTVSGSSTVTIANKTVSGTVVSFDVTGGAHQETAVFRIVATGSLGSIREREMIMPIIET